MTHHYRFLAPNFYDYAEKGNKWAPKKDDMCDNTFLNPKWTSPFLLSLFDFWLWMKITTNEKLMNDGNAKINA